MATKCYNKAGGKYSGAALSAFVGSTYGDCVGGKTDMKVTKKVGMQVAVAPGVALIGKGEAYPYIVENDSEITFTIDKEPTDDRTDSIVAYVDNSVSAGTDVIDNTGKDILKIVVVKGSPMGEPSYPPIPSMIQKAIGAGNPYIVLANVTTTAGESELGDGPKFIQDTRKVAAIQSAVDIDWTNGKMPSPNYSAITDAGSGLNSWAAPSAGFFSCKMVVLTTQFSSVTLMVNRNKVGGIQWASTGTAYNMQTYQQIAVAKGDVVTFTNTGDGYVEERKFVPLAYK